jgi:hypothetical protein
LIDRTGQVWEDGGNDLVYLVFESSERYDRLIQHHCVILYSDLPGYSAGECVLEFESREAAWEKTTRRRVS